MSKPRQGGCLRVDALTQKAREGGRIINVHPLPPHPSPALPRSRHARKSWTLTAPASAAGLARFRPSAAKIAKLTQALDGIASELGVTGSAVEAVYDDPGQGGYLGGQAGCQETMVQSGGLTAPGQISAPVAAVLTRLAEATLDVAEELFRAGLLERERVVRTVLV